MPQTTRPRSARIDSNASDKPQNKRTLRLWLKLLSCQSMAEDRIRSKLRDKHGITLPQFDVLAELENADRPLTMTELSQNLVVSNGNITGVIDRLERDKFLSRIRSKKDRRVQHIELTNQGRKKFIGIAHDHQRWVAQLFASLDTKNVDKIISLLNATKESIIENNTRV